MSCKVYIFVFSPFCGCGESQAFQPDVGNAIGPKAVHQTLFSLVQHYQWRGD